MDNGKSLVSGIIIFLNEERFIREAIESVFAQTYDNWELLLVDDGSTDGSTQIALQYAEQYPEKVRYLEHPGHQNRGMSASRNLGITHAKGEYIAFLDADDVWLPHTLEQQAEKLDSNPEADMVYGSAQYWYGWTGNPEDSRRDFRDYVEERGVAPNTLIEPPKLLSVFLRDGEALPCTCSVMVRREVVKSVGGFEEDFRGQYEEQAFYAKVGLYAPVFVASECWSRYRQHPDSSYHIAQKTGQHLVARRFFLRWLAEYLCEQGVKDTGIWKLLPEAQFQTHRQQLRTRNQQLRKLEGALEKERREVQRLKARNRQLALQAQSMQNSRTWRLLQRVGYLRAKVVGR